MLSTWFTGCKNITYIIVTAIIVVFASCTPGAIPRNYPVKKPFVYNYNVEVAGNYSNAEKSELESKLGKQLDDSIRVRTVRKFLYHGINRAVLNNPPVLQEENIEKSKLYMRALLISLGYFKDTITDAVIIDTIKNNQYRATVNFFVKPGKLVHIDSMGYNLDSFGLKNNRIEIQQLILNNRKDALIKKGDPFAKAKISGELDRIVTLLRNNGYMRFDRNELYGLWDTVDIALLRPTMDPFEQLEILQQLKERRENPKANIDIRMRSTTDSTKLVKYHIGDITIYPDFTQDSSLYAKKEVTVSGIKVISFQNTFKAKIFPPNLYLHRGDLYDQRNYLRTINRFNQLGSWRLTDIEPTFRDKQDTADFIVRLTPAKRFSGSVNIEGSRNESVISGNLLGLSLNFNFLDRNFARRANQSNTTARFGVEIGKDKETNIKFFQTFQFSLGHNISFPRPILVPFARKMNEKTRNSFTSILAANGAITLRNQLYRLNTINLGWGYDFLWGKKSISIRWPNIEYSSFIPEQRLLDIFVLNPSLRYVFTDGLIASAKAGLSTSGGKGNNINVLRINTETSGLFGLIKNDFFDSNLYRFVKADIELIRKINYKKTSLALRFFAGAGYEFDNTVNKNKRFNLPFFRQYFAGGPNSMRAWGIRKLGPGSYIDQTDYPDNYGDIQLELNAEYRFPFFRLFGIPVNGAAFTDIGNVWFMKKGENNERDEKQVFNAARLGEDLAVGAGIGFRVDFSILVIRLDVSHRLKDPSPVYDLRHLQNKWFGYVDKDFFKGTQVQLGISYPFIL
ncbi:MAG: BamA/TamA family outer membrane protein [Chitinophagaceae bacterium]|nr:BamA/TamA family outer membrane protein [Chitinophagaceae bacterium]MBK8951762.1 BamA/TamA family outer membrane protein [Chitinophagaceae bacterium]